PRTQGSSDKEIHCMRKAILFAVALFALPVLPAVAADNGFYLGGSGRQAELKIDDISDGISTADFKGDDTAFKLIAGIRPLDWLRGGAGSLKFGAAGGTGPNPEPQAGG